jgi:hypothetical protein
MTSWSSVAGVRSAMFAPIGLMPIDDITGRAPLGALHVYLDAEQSAGVWRATDLRALVTRSGVITFPGLGRRRDPAAHGPSRYRVRVDCEHYIARYRRDQDGVEFDVFPYDDNNPPASAPGMPDPFVLYPGPTYPFPAHLLVLRGVVVDAGGAAVRDVEVSIGTTRRVLTDARGSFAISTPRPAAPSVIQVDAADLRSGRIGGAAIPFPPGLAGNVQIVIS